MRTGIGPHPEQTRPRKINYFGPLCQEIWILLGEVPGARVLAGIAVTLAGVAIVLAEPRGEGIAVHARGGGIFLGVVAAACQGVGLVLAKLGMPERSSRLPPPGCASRSRPQWRGP